MNAIDVDCRHPSGRSSRAFSTPAMGTRRTAIFSAVVTTAVSLSLEACGPHDRPGKQSIIKATSPKPLKRTPPKPARVKPGPTCGSTGRRCSGAPLARQAVLRPSPVHRARTYPVTLTTQIDRHFTLPVDALGRAGSSQQRIGGPRIAERARRSPAIFQPR